MSLQIFQERGTGTGCLEPAHAEP